MFLKSLEIRGFKSFADKTELVFKNGITAIVGPNGSGKSNISDAVKWVLGEQSVKNLRGGKMQDVIFSGTEFRKPVGLAQVTLVLDNSDGELQIDYSDVTIMRRIYRSGESEYYINNTKCRLKDIQELFMDTGIGKEGYSIIGQGKIEAVLSGKPEDRRSLLEEAAGIVKFKTRKEEAERRLENTEQNIQRINDIFSTYEERIEPLRIENEKAKKFLEISGKLKAKEVTLVLDNIDRVEKKIDTIKNDITENEDTLKSLNNEKNNYEEKLDKLNEDLEKFELENNEERRKYYSNKSDNQKLLSEIDLLNERIKNLSAVIDKTTKNLEQLKEKLLKLNAEKANERLYLEELVSNQNMVQDRIWKYETIINDKNKAVANMFEAVKKAKDYEVELLSKISQSKNEINIMKNDIVSLENKLQELKISSEAHANSIKINYTTKNMLNSEIISMESKILEYEEQIKKYKKEIGIKNKKLINDEKKLKELSLVYNKTEANCNALINLEKYHEGYNKAVKVLMQHIDDGKITEAIGKACILGEILKVDKNFETAIEITLGPAISNIITLDENIAKRLIKYLKDNTIGRATFLPLTIIKGKKISVPAKVKEVNGYIGVASELITFDEKYTNIIEYTLGRTIVSENMDSALLIARQTNYNFKIVTLTGEVVNPGGALTGGSIYNKSSNIIGRKREIEELQIKLQSYEKDIKSLNDIIIKNKNDIKCMDDLCLNLKDEIHYENIEKTKINEKINSIDNETEKLKRNLETANNEILLIKENLEFNAKDLNEIQNKIDELVKLEKENSLKILNLEEGLNKEKEETQNINNEITNFRIKKAQLDETISNKNKELQRLEEDIKQISFEIQSLELELDESNKEINKSQNKINENANKITEINQIILEFEDKFKDIDIKRIKIKEDIKSNKEKLNNLILLCDKNEKSKNNLQISLARHESERDTCYNKLNEEMELTYAEAIEIKLQDEDMDQCKKDIVTYKNEISRLGIVNLGAIEEYKELLEKYTFMKMQKEDLIKAKEELINVVKEMTEKMRAVFNENFNKLRINFNETFKELFKGGNADLILEEGDELTANIEINVQPPGKKLQNINLMSGGEKGLSAIALLFAILKMKPTPFCILDEIEAALDDSNVSRYAEFLKKFSGNTQFIIITHRKGSMEVGDVLYGVTMEEKGISKIVSVDLSK